MHPLHECRCVVGHHGGLCIDSAHANADLLAGTPSGFRFMSGFCKKPVFLPWNCGLVFTQRLTS